MVRRGLVIAWRLAGSPTWRSPLSVKATTLGVRRLPSWLGMTLTSAPSMTATTELVVPRSMPMIFSSATVVLLSYHDAHDAHDAHKIQRHASSPVILVDRPLLPLISGQPDRMELGCVTSAGQRPTFLPSNL